jgi:hypothetical protein
MIVTTHDQVRHLVHENVKVSARAGEVTTSSKRRFGSDPKLFMCLRMDYCAWNRRLIGSALLA